MKTKKSAFTITTTATLSLLARGLFFWFLSGSIAVAQDVWIGGGPDELWSTQSNWSTPPPGATHEDIVMTGPGHLDNTADTTLYGNAPRAWILHSILFPDGAPNFLIHINVVTIEATATPGGIINSSGKLQILDVDAGNWFANTTPGVLTLNSATIGNNVLVENKGATDANPNPGATNFYDASAGHATINNFGGNDIRYETGGQTVFGANATGGNALIVNLGGDSPQGAGGNTFFKDGASGGSATIHNLGATATGASGAETRFTGFGTGAGNATIVNDGSAANSTSGAARTIFDRYTNAGTATITNNAGVAQAGYTAFSYGNAGRAFIINQSSGFFGQAGRTDFSGTASADEATIVNQGGAQFLGHGGTTTFGGSADAGTATLIAQAGAPGSNNRLPIPGGLGGRILFNDHSTAGTADVQVLGNGAVDISGHAAPGITIGTIEGDGQVYLGANNLSVGNGNNTSAFFYGSLHDGGNSGGTGGSFTKVGPGSLGLEGVSDYTGATTVASGKLVVDGNIAASSGVIVDSGATLGGHGVVSGISGAGTIAPGNSPGILTATQIDPIGGLDFVFDLTQAGSPTYGNAAASGNDLLHLTGPVPFTSLLSSANQITIDFSGASLTDGQFYLGGFFTDASTDSAIFDQASFLYLGLGGHTVQFDGFTTEAIADFADGTVLNGEVMKFEIENGVSTGSPVPEPSTYGLFGAFGLAVLVWKRRWPRR